MPISKIADVVTETEGVEKERADRTGVVNASRFAVCDDKKPLKQIQFDVSAQTDNTKTTVKSGAIAADIEVTMPTSSGSLSVGAEGAGAKNGATVTASEQGNAVVHKTVLTLASTPVTVGNTTGASFGGVKVYDFPEGRVLVLGVTASLSFNWTGQDIDAAGSGDFSIGTTITSDATLNGTDVDLLPSSAMLDPFVLGVGTGTGALAASAQFDGTATAKDACLNLIIDDADVADGASDIVLVSGTVTMTWINLGDF